MAVKWDEANSSQSAGQHLAKPAGRPPDGQAQLAAVILESAFGSADVRVDQKVCQLILRYVVCVGQTR